MLLSGIILAFMALVAFMARNCSLECAEIWAEDGTFYLESFIALSKRKRERYLAEASREGWAASICLICSILAFIAHAIWGI